METDHVLPAELQSMLALHLGVPTSSVTTFARHMREAGFLSKQGRGIYAARMTPKDCAVLLCSVAGALGPAESASNVSAFMAARPQGAPAPGVLSDLGLVEGMPGIDAVARIVEAVRDGDAERVLADARLTLEQAREAFRLTFKITAPVRLTIQFAGYSVMESRDFLSDVPGPALAGMSTFRMVPGDALVSLGLALRA